MGETGRYSMGESGVRRSRQQQRRLHTTSSFEQNSLDVTLRLWCRFQDQVHHLGLLPSRVRQPIVKVDLFMDTLLTPQQRQLWHGCGSPTHQKGGGGDHFLLVLQHPKRVPFC